MSALDQSLDAIIASSRPKRPSQPKKTSKSKIGKSVSKPSAVSNRRSNRPIPRDPRKLGLRSGSSSSPSAPASSSSSALDYATKVVVHGLPKDIRSDNIKVCFFNYKLWIVRFSILFLLV